MSAPGGFYQYPQPFQLPDVVELADGRRFTGRRAAVYWLLRLTLDDQVQHRVGSRQGPPGWVPRFYLVEPWSGGASGDRRVRELREYGVEVEIQDFGDSETTLYRISRDEIAAGRSRRHPTPSSTARAPSPPAAAPAQALGPLAGLEVWTTTHEAGAPAGAEQAQLRVVLVPGQNLLAPAAELALELEEGRIDEIEADERYLEQLRTAYRKRVMGRPAIVRELSGVRSALVRCRPVAGWSPARVLEQVLEALGATVWREEEAA